MDIKSGRMVFLGYGKYWRSDRIVGLVPIEDDRGPGRRTDVFVEDRAQPIVASRTEDASLADLAATDDSFQLEALRASIAEQLEALHAVSPVLLRALLHEHHSDVEKGEERLRTLLMPGTGPAA